MRARRTYQFTESEIIEFTEEEVSKCLLWCKPTKSVDAMPRNARTLTHTAGRIWMIFWVATGATSPIQFGTHYFACSVLLRHFSLPRLTESRVPTNTRTTHHSYRHLNYHSIYLLDRWRVVSSFASQPNVNFAFNNQLGARCGLDDDDASVWLSRLIEHILDVLFVSSVRHRTGPTYVTDHSLEYPPSFVRIICLRALVAGSTP